MSEEEALLDAVRRDPEDDTVRLAYADFLDERGQPRDRDRAEFIRVQIAHFRTTPCKHTHKSRPATRRKCAYCQLMFRNAELYSAKRAWYPNPRVEIYGLPLREQFTVGWRRGFIHTVIASCATDFLIAAHKLFQFPVGQVTLSGSEPATDNHGNFWWMMLLPRSRASVPKQLWHASLGCTFTSREAALAHLSLICVQYGRKAYDDAHTKG